jgi:hypothetical protein
MCVTRLLTGRAKTKDPAVCVLTHTLHLLLFPPPAATRRFDTLGSTACVPQLAVQLRC